MRFTYQTGAQPLEGYTIQRGIHRGGFGEVYFAHSAGGKEVALKLLHQQDQDVEIRGVTQCLNLKHPNLVNLFDLKTDTVGDHWVVMEYVAGSSLEDVLASFPDGLPLNEVRDWLCGLVSGVAHLHDRAIVHRDLKPANVYRENGIVKVGDVGLSKRLDSDHRRQHTQSVGTVYYMAPEVAKGQYGPEVDVYSLGIMLYEMITGKLPFTGETTAEILMKHLTAQPDLTPIPKGLRPTLARALEKDPRKRTPTARQLERDFLRAVSLGESELIPESSFLPPIPNHRNGTGTHSANHLHKGPSPWIQISVNRPFPNAAAATENSDLRPETLESQTWKYLCAAGLAIGALWIVGVRFGHGHHRIGVWTGLSLIVAAFFVAKAFKPSRARGLSSSRHRRRHAAVEACTAKGRDRFTVRDCSTERTAPAALLLKERLAGLGGSLTMAAVVATFLSTGIYLVLGVFQHADVMPSVEHATLYAAISIIGSWLTLIAHAITSGSSLSKSQRWTVMIATGIAIGTCAYGLEHFLMAELPTVARSSRPVFSTIGVQPLTAGGINPSWLGYAWFFGGWMALRRMSRDMDPNRKHRYRLTRVLGAMAIGYLMSFLFAFPQWYAVLWAGTISNTIQLASTWVPRGVVREGGRPSWDC